jgi:hypothetical protein
MTTMTMARTMISVARKNNKRKATMMNQPEEDESNSAPLLAAVADGGRSCFSCRIMKKRVDFPRSLCKIQTECRACLSIRSSGGSIETQEEESAAEKYLNECHYQQQQQYFHHYHHQPKPHFVLIHGAEIV